MSQHKSGRVKAEELRKLFNEFTEKFIGSLDRIPVDLSGNSLVLHLEGATINITVNQKGGVA